MLDTAALRSRLIRPGGFVTALDVVEQTSSTNEDLLIAARSGAGEGTVRVAEFQSAGRGRFDRVWTSPPRAGLTVSVLVRPDVVPRSRWGWLPLLTGLSVRAAVQATLPEPFAGHVRLKWPNDLLLAPDGRKVAGILVQAASDAAVIGIGINVDHAADELPSGQATSLRLAFADAAPSRSALLVAVLSELEERYTRWRAAEGDAETCGLHAQYQSGCDTLARAVRVERGDGDLQGTATSIDASGSLVLETRDGSRTLSAGDVVHLRVDAR